MQYVDTSVLVSAFTSEGTTLQMQKWLSSHRVDRMAISGWTIAEMSSALALKVRMRKLNVAQRDAILMQFNDLMIERFVVLSVDDRYYRTAAKFADRLDLGLRGGDALHLAIASDHSATVCCLDKRMAEAGPQLGIETLLLG